MAYKELIKNFNNIRDYMRDFYVYGFKHRGEYTRKSSRAYDNERRRIESWLGEYMSFNKTAEGKQVFISIDTRISNHNPLYKAWKTKSFTDGDITLHFILLDILSLCEKPISLKELMSEIDSYLEDFADPKTFDESTVRKKLGEYEREGLVVTESNGKAKGYSLNKSDFALDAKAMNYFSEVAPCGVVGSYLLDKAESEDDFFRFKHHYITNALDSEVLCEIFMAISERRRILIESVNRSGEMLPEIELLPLKVMVSVQNGRQYLMAYSFNAGRILPFRIDRIQTVEFGAESEDFASKRQELDEMLKHMWGVSTHQNSDKVLEHVEFVLEYNNGERHIPKRLNREKRCGSVEIIDDNHCKFTADVLDTNEMLPWIRTFICRITDLSFSNKEAEKTFRDDIAKMYDMYEIEGGEEH